MSGKANSHNLTSDCDAGLLAECEGENTGDNGIIMVIGWSKQLWFAGNLVKIMMEGGGVEVWIWILPEGYLLVVAIVPVDIFWW
jgi:hypothetical protein